MTILRSGALGALLGLSLLQAPAAAADRADERAEMVRIIELETTMVSPETGIGAIDPAILDVLREVPRHAFVPEPLREYAYRNHALPVGYDQNIAAPLLVALMTHLLALQPDDVVFETGTGEGYHAAVLSRLVSQVYSVEVIEPLALEAGPRLQELGYDNVETQAADGYYGWPEKAPFDAVLLKEAVDHVPPSLLHQLKPGGRLVLPLGPAHGPQMLTLVTKGADGRVREERIMPVRFSPMQGGERL